MSPREGDDGLGAARGIVYMTPFAVAFWAAVLFAACR